MDDGFDIRLFNLTDRRGEDYSEHNAEVAALWTAFEARRPSRTPVRFTCNPRILMLDPSYNVRGITYREYMNDPEVMGQAVLEFRYWLRHYLPGDAERGLPEQWNVSVDFENHYDAAWFGCPVHYRDGQVPDTTPILNDDNKRMLFDRGMPDPFAGEWAERCLQFLDHFHRKSAQGWTFMGRPVIADKWAPFCGCDGLFTIATSLRGSTAICLDLLTDPDYAAELIEFIHAAVANRMKAWREHFGSPIPTDGFGAADDAIEMLSEEQYQTFVLPLHRRLFDQFATPKNRAMHLCGNAQRHFKTIRDELGVSAFDTGFPIDFGALRKDLGPDVLVSGGAPISFFLQDDLAPLIRETERILNSGIRDGGRFILQEANNLPPCARLAACQAYWEMGRKSTVVS
ncbi:MAG TPA: uroporphyrinogen decarboxylase family protein [Candidatus Hydrogenedentes bacterium]|nr:uroporphyrinogen decarboxylase family protein [Candidatus Hydrogenedentota bacterium]HRT18533.1 uroporphyrinogen decarboxylase family protein [Candidatus Hydrogenedentota bacterium]HRT63552.1 uroporphyrinogen decarboxylase family protein [Candidatus Hydrogenedentota bacterium]